MFKKAYTRNDYPRKIFWIDSVHYAETTPQFVVRFSVTDTTGRIYILLASGAGKSFIRRDVIENLQLTQNL